MEKPIKELMDALQKLIDVEHISKVNLKCIESCIELTTVAIESNIDNDLDINEFTDIVDKAVDVLKHSKKAISKKY